MTLRGEESLHPPDLIRHVQRGGMAAAGDHDQSRPRSRFGHAQGYVRQQQIGLSPPQQQRTGTDPLISFPLVIVAWVLRELLYDVRIIMHGNTPIVTPPE